MKNQVILILCGFLIIYSGCSEAAPVLEKVDWRLIYRDQGFQREELVIFVRVSDPDTDDDPHEITVIAQNTGFQWKFERNDWIQVDINKEILWGMPGIIPYEGDQLPNVQYTVRLTDLAGQNDETTFRLKSNRPLISSLSWPTASIVRGRLQYVHGTSKNENPVLILRSNSLDVIKKVPAINGYLIPDVGASWWEIWLSRGDIGSGIRLGPYPLPSQ